MKLTNETKTGIFVLICLAALLGLLMKIGNFNWFKQGYLLKTRFHFTGGVKKNAPVRLSGVDVGEVKNIRLLYDNQDTVAEVDLWLEEDAKVRKDSLATVATLGLMGEKYVEIRAGSSAEFASFGELLPSEEPVRLEDLIDLGKKVASDIGTTAKDISKVANHVGEAIQDNRPKLDSIFDNLEETSENFNDFSQDVKYHPWKVLARGKETPKEQMLKDREARRIEKAKQRGKTYVPQVAVDTVESSGNAASGDSAKPKRSNFGPAKS